MNLIEALRARDFRALRAAVKADPKAARSGRATCEAGRVAWREGFEVLLETGADLNAPYRNYRALHSLLQDNPHAASGKPTAERIACLEWLMANGADPELTGAWPAARAVVVAGMVGIPEYVKILRAHGAKWDIFAAGAAADRKAVAKALAENAALARERDAGELTALHCACGSRMPKADRVSIAAMLLDAGAEIGATARSWSHEVDAIYFAAGVKDLALFGLLLDRGADRTAGLSCAMWNGAYELAELAIARGAEPDRAKSGGKPLLNDLIRWGQFEAAFWLLDHGANCNLPDENGWTAVHQAASRGNERALRAVLDAGGDKMLPDRSGQTPRDLTRSDKIAEILQR